MPVIAGGGNYFVRAASPAQAARRSRSDYEQSPSGAGERGTERERAGLGRTAPRRV